MQITASKTTLFKEGDDLVKFITNHLPTIPEKSVLAVTSKIVALAERRTIALTDNIKKEELIKAESEWATPTKWAWLTIKDGILMASAGIDESNADGKYILLPKDSFVSAQNIRNALAKHYQLKNFGVVITDSHTAPLRKGVTGITLGYAGFKGLRDYTGEKDIFGREFKFSSVNIADSLAAAAVLTMGEGREQQPLALLTETPVTFTNQEVDPAELLIPLEDDTYLPFLKN